MFGVFGQSSVSLKILICDFIFSFYKDVLIIHGSALLETVLACVCTLLLIDPIGTFEIRSCPILQSSDWYTLFHNPNLDYERTLHCTQEAVYPL